MKNTKKHNPHNTWGGFGTGIIAGVGIAYFLGTKKGREFLKKIITITENLEDEAEDIIGKLGQDALEYTKEAISPILENTRDFIEDKKESNSILDKITSFTKKQGFTKKFFLKDGKLEESD